MNLPRFFCPGPLVAGTVASLPEGAARHAARVLRLVPGDGVVLFDGGEGAGVEGGVVEEGGLLAVGGTIFLRQRTPVQPQPVAVQDLGPPDQAKPAPKIIRWHIESEPSGAEIFQVDTNENLGKTPFRVEQPMKAGAVKLELRLQGYKPQPLTLDGDKDAEPPPVKLEKEKRKGKKK